MIKAEPKVGINAQNPGNMLSSLMINVVIKIAKIAENDKVLVIVGFFILRFKWANMPPTAICQNLQKGK